MSARLPIALLLAGCTPVTGKVVGPDQETCEPLQTTPLRLEVRSTVDDPVARAWVPLLIEAELAEVEGLVPRLEPLPPLPGLELPDEEQTVWLDIDADLISATWCTPVGCETAAEPWDPTRPEWIATSLANDIARQQVPTLAEPVAPRWAPQDPYTRLVAARAADLALGNRPEPENPGSRRTDPVERAIWLQPSLAPSQWLALRVRDGAEDRIPALRRLARESDSPLDRAILAEAVERAGEEELAAALSTSLVEANPDDGRWRRPAAERALAVEDYDAADAALERLPDSAEVVRMKVAIEDAVRDDGASPDLLERWADVDEDAEPIRRLIDHDLDRGDLDAAMELTEELAARGDDDRADALADAVRVNRDTGSAPLADLRSLDARHAESLDLADEALARLALLQNRWMRRTFDIGQACDPGATAILTTIGQAGAEARRRIRGVREVELAFRAALRDAAVAPVLSRDTRARFDDRLAEAATLDDRYRAAIAVQNDQILPLATRCR